MTISYHAAVRSPSHHAQGTRITLTLQEVMTQHMQIDNPPAKERRRSAIAAPAQSGCESDKAVVYLMSSLVFEYPDIGGFRYYHVKAFTRRIGNTPMGGPGTLLELQTAPVHIHFITLFLQDLQFDE